MERLQSTTTRLRRTFTYDPDSDEDSTPSVMDEQEQESFIQRMVTHNARRNAQFRQLLLAMPAIASIPYTIGLFTPQTFFVSFLALSSLAATAYLLYFLPLTKTGISTLDNIEGGWGGIVLLWTRRGQPRRVKRERRDPREGWKRRRKERRGRGSSEESTDEEERVRVRVEEEERRRIRARLPIEMDMDVSSPLLQHLPVMNLVLSVVVAVAGWLNHRWLVGYYQDAVWRLAGLGNLPLVINGVVIVAKMMMAGVDPEKELNKLRYGYKGA
ncbi:hypothetical protein QBC34DRAFT_460498 [Podospora aff. communis PSN243]|uniref:Uncharacterized protein n=1 Tax=Podospora aff. communis PSN243 TaxID=3040156 RepID=A0AAV9H478_9PEZI|nr:hypothetical protein QBC34DRAFT_460498 [Podospora aff. communis PSN243]